MCSSTVVSPALEVGGRLAEAIAGFVRKCGAVEGSTLHHVGEVKLIFSTIGRKTSYSSFMAMGLGVFGGHDCAAAELQPLQCRYAPRALRRCGDALQ